MSVEQLDSNQLFVDEQEIQERDARIQDFLDCVRIEPDAREQLWMLGHFNVRRNCFGRNDYGVVVGTPAEREALAGALASFASDETASPSLSVRVEALERALELGYQSEMRPLTELDRANLTWGAREPAHSDTDNARYQEGRSYAYLSKVLLECEAIPRTALFPDPSEYELEKGADDPSLNPVLAYAFLNDLTGVRTDVAEQFRPLISSLHKNLASFHGVSTGANIELRDWAAVGSCNKLLKYGGHYASVLTELLTQDGEFKKEYLRLLGDISEKVPYAAHAFPARYEEGTVKGMEQLLADGLYAALYHVTHGQRIEARLPLGNQGASLQVSEYGQGPTELLEALNVVFDKLQTIGWSRHRGRYTSEELLTSFDVSSILAAGNEDFSLFRLVHRHGYLDGTVSIRPRGGKEYNPSLEYGRKKEGAEGSISYVFEVGCWGLQEIGRHRGRGDDRRISIRLDREGRAAGSGSHDSRNPAQQEGVLSLDVGSVLGKDWWLSTRLGRFLAFGNMLRTTDTGVATNLNHMTEYFTAEDGDADVFAAATEELIAAYERKRLGSEDIIQLFGVTALKRGVRRK